MKHTHVKVDRGCSCEAYPFCEHAPNASKYTAGPWDVYVLADDSETYGNIAGMPIVTAHGHETEVCGACFNPADARLISAAPDLLQAAEQALAEFVDLCDADETLNGDKKIGQTMRKLQAAISKAR
jgi:hypothetical protein